MPRANPLHVPKSICRHLTNYVPKAGTSCLCRKHHTSCLKISEPIRRRISFARQVARSRYSRNGSQALGITTVPATQSGWTRRNGWGSAKDSQLHLISNQPKNKLHSQLDQGPLSQADRIAGYEPALLHPADAIERGIGQHDIIRVFNSRGACLCTAVLSDDIRQGVIQISTGAWLNIQDETVTCAEQGNPNVLCLDKGTSKLGTRPHCTFVRSRN